MTGCSASDSPATGISSNTRSRKRSGSRLSYDIYLVPRWNQTSNAYEGTKERAPPYDVSDGRDICLRIRGGNMLGGRFVGNTVRVTSAEIQAAMSEG